MFGFLKRDLSEIDGLKYQMLAISTSSNALAVTISLLAQSSRRDENAFLLLYNEVLAFAVCLAQMRIQKKFRLKDGHDIVAVVEELQQQFRDLPVSNAILNGQEIAITRDMLDNATTDFFFDRVSCYGARDYRALGITDEVLEAFCKITRQIPSVIKGAGWTMALLMFQVRTAGILFEESDFPHRLLPMLTAAREGCQFIMDKCDHVLTAD